MPHAILVHERPAEPNTDSNRRVSGAHQYGWNGINFFTVRDRIHTACVPTGTPGDRVWDRWEDCALQLRIDPALAALGKKAMRMAYENGWRPDLYCECGWGPDAGAGMFRLATAYPKDAWRRWEWLCETDGEQEPPERNIPPAGRPLVNREEMARIIDRRVAEMKSARRW